MRQLADDDTRRSLIGVALVLVAAVGFLSNRGVWLTSTKRQATPPPLAPTHGH